MNTDELKIIETYKELGFPNSLQELETFCRAFVQRLRAEDGIDALAEWIPCDDPKHGFYFIRHATDPVYTKVDEQWYRLKLPALAASAPITTGSSPSAQHSSTIINYGAYGGTTHNPSLNQGYIYEALGKIVDRIERCGASVELTHAVTLACDLKRAIGNRWNSPDEYAAQRVIKELEKLEGA